MLCVLVKLRILWQGTFATACSAFQKVADLKRTLKVRDNIRSQKDATRRDCISPVRAETARKCRLRRGSTDVTRS
jgi:hypothetical protein